MFTLRLKHFRSWDDVTVTFPENKVTLVYGTSGCGKSTLFEAIEWCLYGKLRGVEPLNCGKMKKSPSVLLRGPNFKIVRLSSNNVRFTLKNIDGESTTYVDSEAQVLIDEMYGVPAVWKACSYVEQKKFNTFLTSTNTVKMGLLNSLAFHGDDPHDYYDKLDTALEVLNAKKLKVQRSFDKANGQYTALPDGVELEDVEAIEKKKDSYSKRIKSGEKVNSTRSKLEGRTEALRSELKKLKEPTKPDSLPSLDIHKLQQDADDYRRYEKLQRDLSETEEDEESDVTLEELEAVRAVESLISTGKVAAKKAGVPYDKTLEATKKKLTDFLSTEEENKSSLRYEELQKELKIYSSPITVPIEVEEPIEPEETDTSSLEAEKQELQQRERDLSSLKLKKILTCPHCNGVSHYHDGRLNKTNTVNLDEVNSELKRIASRIKEITLIISESVNTHKKLNQRYIQLLKSRSTYLSDLSSYERKEGKRMKEFTRITSQLDSIPIPTKAAIPQSKYEDTRKKLSYIKSISYVQAPSKSSAEITRLMLLKTTRQNILNEISLITPNSSAVDELKTYKALEQKHIQYSKALKAYEKKKEELNQEISDIILPDLVDVLRLRKMFDKCTKQLNNHELFLSKSEAYDKTSKLHNELEDIRCRITRLNRLRQVYSETECQGLQVSVVDTINGIVNNVCGLIFQDPMQIELQLFKTVKSTGVTKPQVNFLISYKGGTMNDIKTLSGGEKDRASLAISLAFNSRNRFPLLLLDECFASLDDDLKETTVKALRKNLGCTMLVIMHDGVKGIYDHEINVKSLRNPLLRKLNDRSDSDG